MSQTDMNVANGTGASVRADINNQIKALVTNSSGPTEPSPSFENQWWADTTTNILNRRNSTNSAWIEVMDLDTGLLLASQAEAEAGTDDKNLMTPLRTAEAIAELSGDVVGPTGAIGDQIAVFDLDSGKLIKDGGQTIADVIAASTSGLTTNTITYTANDTYTKPAGLVFLLGFIAGGGGGGASIGVAGSSGGQSSFGSLVTHGGSGSGTVLGGTGGSGSPSANSEFSFQGNSNGSYFDSANFGKGGAGSAGGGSGGSAQGGFFHIVETEIASNETITIGAGGSPGGASGAGKPGKISIIEYINE